MVRYTVLFAKLAQEQFDHLAGGDRRVGRQLANAIERLALHPELGEFLTGAWKGYRKYRAGDYRIIYRIEHARLVVYVITIGDRKDVYR